MDVVAAVTAVAEPIVRDLGLVLDRVEYVDRGGSAVVRVFIDRSGGGTEGVGIDDCVDVTRDLSPTLDVHDIVPKGYTLEVSSPGLDRPLVGEGDFQRFSGRRAALTLRRAIAGGSKLVGVLKGVGDGGVGFELADGRVVTIPLDLIARARLEP